MKMVNMKIVTTLMLLGVLSFVTSKTISKRDTQKSTQSSAVLVGPKTAVHYLRTEGSELKMETKTNFFNATEYTPVPNTIYAEMLVFYDKYSDENYYKNDTEMIQHAFDLLDQVARTFQTLKRTTVRIRLAGIVIPRDQNVFKFIKRVKYQRLTELAIDYSDVMRKMSELLYNHTELFPDDTYDGFMILTQSLDIDYRLGYQVRGMAQPEGMCRRDSYQKAMSRGLIVLDGTHPYYAKFASHELAHLFGVTHDHENNCKDDKDHDTLMHRQGSALATNWSSCAEDFFQFILSKLNLVPCLANVPSL